MDLDPRIVSLQRGSAAAAREQSRLSAPSRPVDVPRELAMRGDPVLASMGVGPGMRPAASADPTARWMGRENGTARGTDTIGSFAGAPQGWPTNRSASGSKNFRTGEVSGSVSDAMWVDIYLSAGKPEHLD